MMLVQQTPMATRYFSRYQPEQILQRRGDAQRMLGRDLVLGRTVLIETRRIPADESRRDSLQRDLAAFQRSFNPSLPRVYAQGQQDGTFVVVMEHVQGRTLASSLAQLKASCNSLSYLRALSQIFVQMAWALQALHLQGISAGTIRADHILVNEAGRARLLISPLFEDRPEAEDLASGVEEDIFALGVLIFRSLAGADVLACQRDATIDVEMLWDAQPLLPDGYDVILPRAMSHDPERRYREAEGLAADLGRVVSTLTVGYDQPKSAFHPMESITRMRKTA